MPARTLPGSDTQRTSALDAAFNKWAATPAPQRAFSADQNTTLTAQRTLWKARAGTASAALVAQITANKTADAQGRLLEQVISHFFQVFNLGVARGIFNAGARAYYKLDASSASAPVIANHADRLTWAQNTIAGEAARQAAEGAAYQPMALPAAADVDAALTAYLPLLEAASTAKDAYDLAQRGVQGLRPAADACILDLWDTIEFTYRQSEPSALRRQAREWGVVYAANPGETPDPVPPAPTPPAA